MVETSEDALKAEALGLIEFSADDNECDNCDASIGFANSRFISCVVCAEGDDIWLVCIQCANGVLLSDYT